MSRMSDRIYETAQTMKDVTVTTYPTIGWVKISDAAGKHADIILQGSDAEEFLRTAARLCAENLTSYEDVEKMLAKPYTDALWS